MTIINTQIKGGGGSQPVGALGINTNGVHNVAQYEYADVQVPTTAPALYREFYILNDTLMPSATTTHKIDFTGIKYIYSFLLAYAYYDNTAITGAVNMGDLTNIDTSSACLAAFRGCTGLTSVDLSSVTTINGNIACTYMFFQCSGITSIKLYSLTTIGGQNGCQYMFADCTNLTSVNLSSLTTVTGGGACNGMFQGCTRLSSVDLSGLTTLSGGQDFSSIFSGCTSLTSVNFSSLATANQSYAFTSAFYNCTSLQTVYFGGTTAIDFGTRKNQFQSMFSGCTQNIDVYAPAANQTQIEAFSGYPNFGGTGTVTWHWRS